MLNELTSKDISEWEAFFRLELFEDFKADARMALLAYHVVRTMQTLWLGKKAPEISPIDFFPKWDIEDVGIEEREQTMEEMKEIMSAMVAKERK